jgi:hypothetical protein
LGRTGTRFLSEREKAGGDLKGTRSRRRELEPWELRMLSLSGLAPILVLLLLGAIDLWVYVDAKAHSERGTPVVFSTVFLTVDTPAAWFFGCLLLSIVFIPLYITIRGQVG